MGELGRDEHIRIKRSAWRTFLKDGVEFFYIHFFLCRGVDLRKRSQTLKQHDKETKGGGNNKTVRFLFVCLSFFFPQAHTPQELFGRFVTHNQALAH